MTPMRLWDVPVGKTVYYTTLGNPNVQKGKVVKRVEHALYGTNVHRQVNIITEGGWQQKVQGLNSKVVYVED